MIIYLSVCVCVFFSGIGFYYKVSESLLQKKSIRKGFNHRNALGIVLLQEWIGSKDIKTVDKKVSKISYNSSRQKFNGNICTFILEMYWKRYLL